MKKEDFRKSPIGFMYLDRDSDEFELLHRVTVTQDSEMDFKIHVCDGKAYIVIIENNWCQNKREFYESNSICCPRMFKNVEEIEKFINFFIGRV